jgi:hypothetical protein
MSGDPGLKLRGQLVRSLGALREMLPGSFIERQRPCGKPNCRCADGKHPHIQYLLSVWWEGKSRTFHLPAAEADQIRQRVELHRRFRSAAARIGELNLRRWLRERQQKEKNQENR